MSIVLLSDRRLRASPRRSSQLRYRITLGKVRQKAGNKIREAERGKGSTKEGKQIKIFGLDRLCTDSLQKSLHPRYPLLSLAEKELVFITAAADPRPSKSLAYVHQILRHPTGDAEHQPREASARQPASTFQCLPCPVSQWGYIKRADGPRPGIVENKVHVPLCVNGCDI